MYHDPLRLRVFFRCNRCSPGRFWGYGKLVWFVFGSGRLDLARNFGTFNKNRKRSKPGVKGNYKAREGQREQRSDGSGAGDSCGVCVSL